MAESIYRKASLAMIPYGAKEDELPSIKPTDGSGDFTFSRGSDIQATRVNSGGLIEKAKVNLLLQSNTFSSGSWAKVNVTATGGQAGYDGSNDAWLIEGTGSSVFSYLLQSDSTASVKTRSVYAKAGSVPYLGIWGAGSNLGYFDLSDGSLDSISGSFAITHSITSVGGGWYRCEFTTTGSTANIYLVPSSTANGTILSAGENIYIQDAQLNHGLIAQDYVETTSAAVVEGLTADLPRLDYSGGASCPSLLLEPSRTNIIDQSEYVGGYTKSGSVTTQNDAVSPEGVQNAFKINDSNIGTTGVVDLYQSVSVSTSTDYTFSVFAKKGSDDFIHLRTFAFTTPTDGNTYFDLSNGTIGTTHAGHTPFIEDYGNGWYRCGITFTTDSSDTTGFVIARVSDADNSATMLRDGTHNVYMYGFQFEAGSYPTSYIPTYSAAANRGADDLTKVFSTPISQNGGTFFIELKGSPAGTGSSIPFLFFGHTNSASYVGFGATGNWRIRLNDNGVSRLVSSPISHTEDVKLCVRYGDFGYEYYANGTSFSTYGTAIDLGNFESVTYREGTEEYGNIIIKQVLTFPTALTDAECIALTTI